MKQVTKNGTAKFIKRLQTYRLSLLHLKELGLNDVYSYLIADETDISSALVRKDMAKLGVKGKRRGGYETETILRAIENWLGEDRENNVIVIGMGNIGTAVTNYRNFHSHKINIVAAFDIDPVKKRKKTDVPVYAINECKKLIDTHRIDAAVIAVPSFSAQNVCDQVIQCGIKGILNFAPVNLRVPDDVYVSNVRLSDVLQQVIYHAGETERNE